MVATDALDEPLLAVPGASSHSTHRFEWTQKITWPTVARQHCQRLASSSLHQTRQNKSWSPSWHAPSKWEENHATRDQKEHRLRERPRETQSSRVRIAAWAPFSSPVRIATRKSFSSPVHQFPSQLASSPVRRRLYPHLSSSPASQQFGEGSPASYRSPRRSERLTTQWSRSEIFCQQRCKLSEWPHGAVQSSLASSRSSSWDWQLLTNVPDSPTTSDPR